MAIKISGLTFKQFYMDEGVWGGATSETYHDDLLIFVNGERIDEAHSDFAYEAVADEAMIEVESGFIHYADDKKSEEFTKVLRRWLKAQVTTNILIEVPQAQLAAVTAYVKSIGGKVLIK